MSAAAPVRGNRAEIVADRASDTLALTRALIGRRSLTPDDAGCQELIASRLAPLGFIADTLVSNGVTNLWLRRGTARPLVCFAGHTDVVPTGPRSSGCRTRSRRRSGTAGSMVAAPPT